MRNLSNAKEQGLHFPALSLSLPLFCQTGCNEKSPSQWPTTGLIRKEIFMKRTYGYQNGNTEDSRTKSDINSRTAYSIPHSSWIVKQSPTTLALMFATLSPTLSYALPTLNATLSMLDEVLAACLSLFLTFRCSSM